MYNVSLELLKLYSSRDQLSAQDISAITNKDARIIYENIQCLAGRNFLTACITVRETGIFDQPYCITLEGRVALEKEEKIRKDHNFNEIRAWITLVIAVAAFIKSFFF